MKRNVLLSLIKTAGYHEDARAGMRLYTENRITRAAFDEAFNLGRAARAAGMPCSCYHCNKPEARA